MGVVVRERRGSWEKRSTERERTGYGTRPGRETSPRPKASDKRKRCCGQPPFWASLPVCLGAEPPAFPTATETRPIGGARPEKPGAARFVIMESADE